MSKKYYIARPDSTYQWKAFTIKKDGYEIHPNKLRTWNAAKNRAEILNAKLVNAKPQPVDGRGRPALPTDEKAMRLFFTLRPEQWKAISPKGDAVELKEFAKEAITEKLDRENKTA